MQRPRRTSEFFDDPSGVRRQSRPQQKSTIAPSPSGGGAGAAAMVTACTGGTAKKCRPSRIAVPSRPSSSDRSNNPYLTVNPSQRGFTPQKTPLSKPTANRVLFTAEKQRQGNQGSASGIALHNDKKWVHEQTIRITEHLLGRSTLDGNISTDFVNRGLRQMSIKQFVAIINYFFGYIWGNRYKVGNNYVEDIINLLQKLRYPHPLNKSWLKTPNTQHSFGNVIVLLDFLMDFVPPFKEEGDNYYFDLMEPNELCSLRLSEDANQIPDLEFQKELLRNSEDGFMLWDKQKNEEFDSLQLQTCNLLIQKSCGIPDLDAIVVEIEKQEEILKQLESERPPEDKEMMKRKSQLSHELKNLRREMKILQDECENNDRDIKALNSRKISIVREVENIENEIKSLQEMLSAQLCTVEQRDQMMADVVQHKQMVAIKKRTIQDLESRYYNQQILQSKSIKQFNDQIESFNAHMREIKFSDLIKTNNDDLLNESPLELSLRPEQTELDRIIPLLKKIKQRVVKLIQNNKSQLFQIQENSKQLTNIIDNKLYPKLNALRTSNSLNVTNLQKLLSIIKEKEYELLEKIQNSEEDIIKADKKIEELKSLIAHKKSLIEELKQANEQTMQNAEKKHNQCLEQRNAFLQAYEQLLDECLQSDLLQQLLMQVDVQEMQLEKLRKEFKR